MSVIFAIFLAVGWILSNIPQRDYLRCMVFLKKICSHLNFEHFTLSGTSLIRMLVLISTRLGNSYNKTN